MSSAYKALIIKPLEPLHLGLRNLGGVEEFSIDESLPLPLPSTVLGALGNAAGISLRLDCSAYRGNGVYDFNDFRQLITELFNNNNLKPSETHSDKPYLWGPLIQFNGATHVPIDRAAITDDDLKLYVGAAVKGYDEGNAKLLKSKLRVFSDAGSRIGISINAAGTVEAMFKASYINYKSTNLSLKYLIKNPAKQLGSSLIRLGGEGRSSLIYIEDNSEAPGNGDYAVALQPILMHCDDDSYYDVSIDRVKGLECVEEVYGAFDGERFKVKVVNIGLGFSEVCGLRRPMLKALPQGTVIKLRSGCSGIAVGLLSELGYGSIYRVSL